MFVVKRIYDPANGEDGKRYLVDRLWPRGMRKQDAALDGWLKDLSPSTELRQWFGHDPARREEFRQRFAKELDTPQAARLMDALREEAKGGRVTLLYSAKDTQFNNATCLKDFLENG